MNKLMKKIATAAFGVALAVGVGAIIADNVEQVKQREAVAEVELSVADSFDATTKKYGISAYNSSLDYDNWKVVYGNNSNKAWGYFKMGGKSATLANANPCYIQSISSSTTEYKKVTVSIAAGSLSKNGMSVNSWGVYVYNKAEDGSVGNQIDFVEGGTITNEAAVFDFVPTTGVTWAKDYFYKVSWDLANTTSTNGIICVDKVICYKEKVNKNVEGVEIKTAPTKTDYYTGDNFDAAGLIVTVTYDDSTTEDIAYNSEPTAFAFEPGNNLTLEDESVVITVAGKTCEQAITVAQALSPVIEEAEIEDLNEKTANDYKVVKVVGRVDNITGPEYGNFDLVSLNDGETSILVYGATANATKLAKTDTKAGYYTGTWSSGKNFNSACEEGDVIEMEVVFKYYNQTPEVMGVVVKVYTDTEVAQYFANKFMHLADYDAQLNGATTGLCAGADGYYAKAKAAYNALEADEKVEFATLTNAYNRLIAWAAANGESLNNQNILSSNSSLNRQFDSNNTVAIVAIVALVSISTLGVLVVLKKRKTVNK